jgi:hypothetical protein
VKARKRDAIPFRDACDGENRNDIYFDAEPGDWAFALSGDGSIYGLDFVCPLGKQHMVTFGPSGWKWDGNRDAPTITPSIASTHCGMHVYMTRGEWVLLGDHGRYKR